MPLVSVVIVNHNGYPFVLDCVNSVLDSDYPSIEVILVDTASTDPSLDAVLERFGSEKRLKIVPSNENLHYSKGNNVGIRESRGKYLVILNSDVIVSKNWLALLIDFLEVHTEVGIVQPKLCLMKDSLLDSTGTLYCWNGFLIILGDHARDSTVHNRTREIFSAKGAAMITRTELMKNIGGFDPYFVMFNEDADLCWRIRMAGFRVVYFPYSVVHHIAGASFSKQFDRVNYLRVMLSEGCKSYLAMNFKNLELRNALRVLPLHTISWIFTALVLIHLGKLTESKLVLKTVIETYTTNLRTLISLRRIAQRKRLISDKLVFQGLVRAYPVHDIARRIRVLGRT